VEQRTAPEPAWAPLRHRTFRALWLAALVSNIGTWMQTVGAQWLLVDEPNAPTLVALVQTATAAPVVLLALPSGVLADMFDRRRLLVAVQAFQVVVGVALTVLTAAGQVTAGPLLAFTFALGAGTALNVPAYQSLIPELVPREQLPAAAALGAVSVNLARAVGPALAGLLITHAGVTAVFAVNTASFLAYGVLVATWHREDDDETLPPERFVPALRAGSRFIRHSPVVRRMLLRLQLFLLPAVVLWSLLPLVASRQLHTGAGGYGLLLAGLGVGAIAGVALLPHLRAHLPTNQMMVAATMLYAAALVVLVTVPVLWLVVAVLVLAGVAWVAVLSSLNASLQMFLPNWVRARGLAVYTVVLAFGQAAGSVAWGLLAQHAGLRAAHLLAAAVLLLTAASTAVWPLIDTRGLDRSPAVFWPEPELAVAPEPGDPVVVTNRYRVPPERQPDFVAAMRAVRRGRMRTGATGWELYREGESPHTFVEIFSVPSWDEHLRQHGGRLTGADREAEERALALAEEPPVVAHLFPAP
jgi:MFS family permease